MPRLDNVSDKREKSVLGLVTNENCPFCKELLSLDEIQDMIRSEELIVLDSVDEGVRKIMRSLNIDEVPTFLQIEEMKDSMEVCKLDDDFNVVECVSIEKDAKRAGRR